MKSWVPKGLRTLNMGKVGWFGWSVIYWLIDLLIDRLIDRLIYLLIDWLIEGGGLHYGIHSKLCFSLLTLLSSGYNCTGCHTIQLKNEDQKTNEPFLATFMKDMESQEHTPNSKICSARTDVSVSLVDLHATYFLQSNQKAVKTIGNTFSNVNPTLKAFLTCKSRCSRDFVLRKDPRRRRYESRVKSLEY